MQMLHEPSDVMEYFYDYVKTEHPKLFIETEYLPLFIGGTERVVRLFIEAEEHTTTRDLEHGIRALRKWYKLMSSVVFTWKEGIITRETQWDLLNDVTSKVGGFLRHVQSQDPELIGSTRDLPIYFHHYGEFGAIHIYFEDEGRMKSVDIRRTAQILMRWRRFLSDWQGINGQGSIAILEQWRHILSSGEASYNRLAIKIRQDVTTHLERYIECEDNYDYWRNICRENWLQCDNNYDDTTLLKEIRLLRPSPWEVIKNLVHWEMARAEERQTLYTILYALGLTDSKIKQLFSNARENIANGFPSISEEYPVSRMKLIDIVRYPNRYIPRRRKTDLAQSCCSNQMGTLEM